MAGVPRLRFDQTSSKIEEQADKSPVSNRIFRRPLRLPPDSGAAISMVSTLSAKVAERPKSGSTPTEAIGAGPCIAPASDRDDHVRVGWEAAVGGLQPIRPLASTTGQSLLTQATAK